MMTSKRIVWKRPDGLVTVFTPSRWALTILQRGRADYDSSEDVLALRAAGVPEIWISFAVDGGIPIDLDEHEAKVRRNVEAVSERAMQTYMNYQRALIDGGCTFDEAVRLIAEKDCPVGEYRICDATEVPNGSNNPLREYHHAISFDDRGVKWDMGKARALHRSLLRERRKSKLTALDVEYMRADEAGDSASKASIAKQKQVLRDLTKAPEIDAAASPAELLAHLQAAMQ